MTNQTQDDSDPLLAIKSFLRLPDFDNTPQAKYWKWIVKTAKRCSTEPLGKKQLKKVNELLAVQNVGMMPRAKMCFYFNQVACVATQGELEYWEGQALGCAIPVEHAWLMYKGKVVDAVWGTLDHINSPDGFSAGKKQDYAGIKIPYNMVLRQVASEVSEPILFELFKGEQK